MEKNSLNFDSHNINGPRLSSAIWTPCSQPSAPPSRRLQAPVARITPRLRRMEERRRGAGLAADGLFDIARPVGHGSSEGFNQPEPASTSNPQNRVKTCRWRAKIQGEPPVKRPNAPRFFRRRRSGKYRCQPSLCWHRSARPGGSAARPSCLPRPSV